MSDRAHPREVVRAACAEHGEDVVIDAAVALLTGQVTAADAFMVPAELEKLKWLTGSDNPGGWRTPDPANFYWARVWAARVFLYVWRDDVVEALLVAAQDDAWRVREHVARITAQRELGQLADALLPMLDHELPRVRAAAVRALGAAGEYEHAQAIEDLRDDPDHTVRAAVERALERLQRRLDRDLR